MRILRHIRRQTGLGVRFAKGLAAGLLASVCLLGQVKGVATPSPSQPPPTPTLSSIHTASTTLDTTATRVRRFRTDNGAFVSVRELFEAKLGPGGMTKEVSFLAVEGEPSGSALTQQWSQVYQRFGLLLAHSGCFSIRDLSRAVVNYAVYDFGAVMRAGRLAQRLVVFPNQLDRAFWVIDADLQTSALLYSAEFDGQLRLLSEVEVLSFLPSARVLTANPTLTFPDYATATAQMTITAGLIEPDLSSLASYALDGVEVRDDVLSGQQMIVGSYSDGIDQVLVVQMPGTADWLAGLPATQKGGQAVGRRFRDPTMAVHMFWEGGVTFHVAASGASLGQDALAKQLYLQAIATH
jgi:hypothetical protein